MKLMIIKTNLVVSIILSLWCSHLMAADYTLPSDGSRLIGEVKNHVVVKGDFFQQLAEKYDVGFLALISANPNVDPFLPEEGTSLVIPTSMLLPYGKREGIVINLPELRLYYFPTGQDKVYVFPVGIGQEGLATPAMTTFVSDKRKNPVWRPTKAMKERYFKKHGKHLASEVPPGANNPFGKYALRLGFSEYLIHGTNQRFGVGMRASSGCVRMYDDDIKWLFDNVNVNTSVKIVNQPIKMSYENGNKQLIEIHSALAESQTKEKDASNDGSSQVSSAIPDTVKRFVGGKEKYITTIKQLMNKPKGLVVEL